MTTVVSGGSFVLICLRVFAALPWSPGWSVEASGVHAKDDDDGAASQGGRVIKIRGLFIMRGVLEKGSSYQMAPGHLVILIGFYLGTVVARLI